MVRVRRRPNAHSGSFVLSGGGAINVTGRGAHRVNFGALSGGNSAATAFTGAKSITTSGGMPVGIEVANVNGSSLDYNGDGWTKLDDFKISVLRFGGPEAMRFCKTFTSSTATAGEGSWTTGGTIPNYVKTTHDALVSAGQTAQAARWDIPLTICFKSYDSASFDAAMTAIPSWITEVRYCYQQEADRSGGSGAPWDVTDYLNVYAQMEARRRLHTNAAKVRLLKCLTTFKQIEEYHAGFTANDYYGIGQTWSLGTGATGSPSATGQNWTSVIVGVDYYAPVNLLNQHGYYVDTQTFFTTNWGGQAGNKAWVQRMADISAAAGFDVDWNIPEWGAVLPHHINPDGPYFLETELIDNYQGANRFGDYNLGSVRTAWMQSTKTALENLGCLDMCWWEAGGDLGPPYKFYYLYTGHKIDLTGFIDHEYIPSIDLIRSWAGAPDPPVWSPPGNLDPSGIVDGRSITQTWLNSVPDGGIVQLAAGKTYRIEGTLTLTNRTLTINLNGATFIQKNAPVENTPMFRITGGNVLLRNGAIKGSFAGGFWSDGTAAPVQHAHGVELLGATFGADTLTIDGFGGDGIFWGLNSTTRSTAQSLTAIHDLTITHVGRNAMTFAAANDVAPFNITTNTTGYAIFDVEPATGTPNAARTGKGCDNIDIHDNQSLGTYYLYALQIIENNPTNLIKFRTNRCTDPKGMKIGVISVGGVVVRPTNLTVTGCVATLASTFPAFLVTHTDGLTVTGNTIPMAAGATAMTQLQDCTGFVVNTNTFAAATFEYINGPGTLPFGLPFILN